MSDLVERHLNIQADNEARLERGELVMCANHCGARVSIVDAHPHEEGEIIKLYCGKCCTRCHATTD